MDKKNLSAARRKLEEYKLHKAGSGQSERVESTIFTEVDETDPRSSPSDTSAQVPSYFVPPPTQGIQTFLKNLGQEMQSIHMEAGNDTKILNVSSSSFHSDANATFTTTAVESPASNEALISPFSNVNEQLHNEEHHIFTPTAPTSIFDQENPQPNYDHNQQQFTDAGQSFPVNFFQSTPISHEYEYPIKSPYEPQEFYYIQPQPSTPMFFNVNGDSITPHQPYHQETPLSSNNIEVEDKVNFINPEPQSASNNEVYPSYSSTNASMRSGEGEPTSGSGQVIPTLPVGDNANENRNQPEQHILQEPKIQRRSPTPSKTYVSPDEYEESEIRELQEVQRMKSVQDALEMQLDELRRDNERLLSRQSELVSQLENNEKNVQDLRRERDRSKEDAKKMMQPLNIKYNNLYEENQRIMKNSNDVGMELRSKLQEKVKQYEDMEQAFIIVSKSKMDLAAELDQEREKSKELESQLANTNSESVQLRNNITKLEEKIKVEQQKDGIIHQLEDQIRHFQVQSETLQRELRRSNNKIERLLVTNTASQENAAVPNMPDPKSREVDTHVHSETCHHDHDGHENDFHHTDSHDHYHDNRQEEGHLHHQHGENVCDNQHEHLSGHDHGHSHHDHDDEHDHDHDHKHDATQLTHNHSPLDELVEMKRRLHHLEWENSTFRSDLEKLAIEAKEKRTFEEQFNKVSEECQKLRNECKGLELLVIQLQGENDTIGDYISLYQSQRLALKESAREKDLQLANLAMERETLLRKMEELSKLLQALKKQKQDVEGSNQVQQCNHIVNSQNPTDHAEHEIEGKIINLLSEISSSTLIENFHPCAVCSGQLMNV